MDERAVSGELKLTENLGPAMAIDVGGPDGGAGLHRPLRQGLVLSASENSIGRMRPVWRTEYQEGTSPPSVLVCPEGTVFHTLSIVTIFWTVMAIEIVGFGILVILGSREPRGPEGPVGGWFVLVPPVIWVVFAAAFCVTESHAIRATLTYFLATPLVTATFGPVVDKARRGVRELIRRR